VQHGAKNVVTLFHKPSNAASTRVLTLLKQANAQAAAHATEDQASSHEAQNKLERVEFELDVTEAPPTGDQLKNIIDYLGGPSAVSKVISGAQDEADAVRRLKADGDWPDDQAVKILKNQATAMSEDSVILLDDMVLPERDSTWRATQLDMTMMAGLAAMERSETQWYELMDRAGLEIVKIWKYTEQSDDGIVVAKPKKVA
jgi:arsenate reductase-like glutaredoxin family protein